MKNDVSIMRILFCITGGRLWFKFYGTVRGQ